MSITFYAGFEESPKRWNYCAAVETVNVSNSNGYALIEALHFTAEDGGMDPVSIDTFIDRCNIALVVAGCEDEGIKPSTSKGALGATIIDCGRPAGYFTERLQQLRKMAREGKDHGATHVYAG